MIKKNKKKREELLL